MRIIYVPFQHRRVAACRNMSSLDPVSWSSGTRHGTCTLPSLVAVAGMRRIGNSLSLSFSGSLGFCRFVSCKSFFGFVCSSQRSWESASQLGAMPAQTERERKRETMGEKESGKMGEPGQGCMQHTLGNYDLQLQIESNSNERRESSGVGNGGGFFSDSHIKTSYFARHTHTHTCRRAFMQTNVRANFISLCACVCLCVCFRLGRGNLAGAAAAAAQKACNTHTLTQSTADRETHIHNCMAQRGASTGTGEQGWAGGAAHKISKFGLQAP